MIAAAGLVPRPGKVRMSPQIGYTKPAPTDALTSRTYNECPFGAPYSEASPEIDKCVLAIQTGRSAKPLSV